MSKTIIFHNPRCSKSREGVSILTEMGIDFEIKKYMDTPPTFEELEEILNLLDVDPLAIIRKKEAIFKEKYQNKELSREEWINAMIENPRLIERPIVIEKGKRAVVGRPPVLIKDLYE